MAPLPVPAPGAGLAELASCDAVALFVARAQAAWSGFALTEHNQAAVAQLCRRLDGLPLAIELAAARMRVLEPGQILDRLNDRFALLSRSHRTAPARQTLRACVDWSFELCSKPERLLWARASVFAGGCELDAIEVVCADELLPTVEMLDMVAGLVDKSILIREDADASGRQARYRMLETLREYGQSQLTEIGETEQLGRRHRDWCQQLVEHARQDWVSPRQGYWMGRLRREHPNLRAAAESFLAEEGPADGVLRLTVPVPLGYWGGWGLHRGGAGVVGAGAGPRRRPDRPARRGPDPRRLPGIPAG